MGKHLRSLLHQAGYVNSEGTASTESFGSSEATRGFGEFMVRYFEDTQVAARIIALGLATTKELDDMQDAWRKWGTSPSAFAAILWCEALGWKKS